MLIDTHCHLDFPEYAGKESEVIARAQSAGIQYFLNVGSTKDRSERSVALSREYGAVYASVGIHPHDAESVTPADLESLVTLAQEPKVVAWGEVGLDYFRNLSPQEEQKRIFDFFLTQSQTKPLPYIFHIREAFSDFFKFMEKYQTGSLKGVAHCFTGNLEDARRLLDFGLYVSFTGILTYKKNNALREIAEKIPMEKILLETDAPFLAPEGFRGKVNEPAYLVECAKVLASIKGISLEEVARITTQNCRDLFGFPK